MFLESLNGFASTYIGGQEDFSFFSFLFLLVNYTYIFRLTMRDLFNGRESGNGIRTRRSWEPFRSALASSSFTARSQMWGKINKKKKKETASISRVIYDFFFLSREITLKSRSSKIDIITSSFGNHLVGYTSLLSRDERSFLLERRNQVAIRKRLLIIEDAPWICREKTEVLSTAVFRDELIPDSWFP